MKRIFSLILVVAMVMGLSVQGFANESLVDSISSKVLIEDETGLTKIGTFMTSALSDDEKEFMRDFFAVMTGSKVAGEYHYYLLCSGSCFKEGAAVNFSFVRTYQRPLAFCYCYNNTVDSSRVGKIFPFCPLVSADGYSSVDSVLPVECMYWGTSSKAGQISKRKYYNTMSGAYSAVINYTMLNDYCNANFICWSSDNSFVVSDDEQSFYYIHAPQNYRFATAEEIDDVTVEYPVGLAIVDDDGLIDSVTPDPDTDGEDNENGDSDSEDGGDDGESSGDAADGSESTGGGTAEFPDSSTDDNDTTIELPKIDYDSTLVPYDLDVWDSIPKALMPQLKKVVSIAFPIVLICMALEAFVLIVRHLLFAWLHKGGKGGGGVSSDE